MLKIKQKMLGFYRLKHEDAAVFKQINEGSEPFLLWVTGEAYNEN